MKLNFDIELRNKIIRKILIIHHILQKINIDKL